MRTYFSDMFLQNAVPAVIAERTQALLDYGGRDSRVLLQPFSDLALERIELAGTAPQCRSLRGRMEILPDRLPTDFQMAFNLANGPSLGPVKPVQVVDLIGGEHRLSPFMQQAWRRHQKDVVCKMAARAPGQA